MKVKVNYSEIKDLVNRVNIYDEKCLNALEAYAKISAKDLETKAKKNAKWIDRTGQARKSIKGTGERLNANLTITLEGYAQKPDGEDYFQYLEYAHKKKNAILHPTIEENETDVLKGYEKTLLKIEL